MAARATRIPARLAGLCSGARGDNRSMAASTASSITVGAENSTPPITTRWPTAARAEPFSVGPWVSNASSTCAMASP